MAPSPVIQQKAIIPKGRIVLKAKKLSVFTLFEEATAS
jgi:hypothetical protein